MGQRSGRVGNTCVSRLGHRARDTPISCGFPHKQIIDADWSSISARKAGRVELLGKFMASN